MLAVKEIEKRSNLGTFYFPFTWNLGKIIGLEDV